MALLGRSGITEGVDVKKLQDYLIKLGHLSEADRRGGEGRFGPRTEAALRAFQKACALSSSGVHDLATQTAMHAILNGTGVRRGATNTPVVRGLQDSLVALGIMDRGLIGAGAGKFGPYTEAALKRFQARKGIQQTGVLGPQTYKAITDELRMRADGADGGTPSASTGGNQALARAATNGVTDRRFETEPTYCGRFVNQCVEMAYHGTPSRNAATYRSGPYTRFFGGYKRPTATTTGRNFQRDGCYVVRVTGGRFEPGDILFKMHGSGGDGHVGIYVGGGRVAENSSTPRGRVQGAKGYRSLAEYGHVDLVVRLPPR